MFAQLVGTYHLHPIVDHFTIALLTFGIVAELLSAAALLLARGRTGFLSVWGQKLRSTALLLMIAGAAASALSFFTGDAEADRLWDTMSPSAQQILLSSNGSDFLSHAVLGQRLMYAFLILAAWRVMLELSSRLRRTRIAFLIVAMVAAGALLYQGKTGGELVYEHGVGMPRVTGSAQQIGQPPETARAVGASVSPPPGFSRRRTIVRDGWLLAARRHREFALAPVTID
jgi:uncharacterized membrane protein